MKRTTSTLASVVAVLVVLAPLMGLASVGIATAAVENVEERPDNYAVEQGDDCIQIEPIGDADTNVSAYYDYRSGSDGAWSSHGTTDRQQSQVSQLYVYRGSEGDSLVFLHDALNDDDQGGAISMTISGLPEVASWEVEDDDYDGQDDRFQHNGSESQIDWMWAPGRNDGGAVRGVAASGYDEITIDPAFSEDSYAASIGWEYADDPLQWRVGTGNDTLVALDQNETVTFRQGVCRGTSPPEAHLTADPVTPDAGENVTLNASGSSDEDGIVTYRWDVDGDGEFDAETADATYVHAYNEAGQVEPTVEVVDGTNETATASTTIDIQEAVSVTAVADVPVTAEVGENVTLDGSNSTGSVEIDSYEWAIEGGPELTGETVQHQFTEGGTYNVTLTVTGDGASDETTVSIEVIDDEPPNAELSAPETAEAGETVTLDASASTDDHEISEYRWDTDGDGSTDETTETARLNVTYTAAGEYTPTVAVVDSRNQFDEASTTIEITRAEEFRVTLDANRTTVTTGEPIAFEATATPRDVADSYEYDFDDGTTASGASAVHAFGSTGAYNVTVQASSSDGRTANDTVVVTVEADEPPVAALDAPETAEVNETITLDASASSDDHEIAAYEWDVDGDGEFEETTSNAQNNVSYPEAGEYSPTVRVRDGRDQVDQASTTVEVTPPEFSVEVATNRSTVAPGESIAFEATTSPAGAAQSFEYDFDDGETASGANVVHAYDSTGEYNVTVEAESSDGRTANDTVLVTVEEDEPPLASIDAPGEAVVGENVTLDASASADDREITAYEWDVDGDGEYDETTQAAHYEVTYSEAGEYEPTVRVRDAKGQTDEASTNVSVSRAEEFTVAVAANRTTVTAGEPIKFEASATPEDDVEQYEFDLGDGTTVVDPSPIHSYEAPGEYTVEVVAESSDGRTASDSIVVTVEKDDPPVAKLDARAEVEVGETVWLDARDSWDDHNISKYAWDVDGDGTIDQWREVPKIPVSYSEPGEYSPTVRVYDERGQADEASTTIDVSYAEEFTVDIGANRTTVSTGEPIKFEATATPDAGVDQYEFDLGDGTTAIDRCPIHAYDEPGEYTVTVLTTRDDGQTATDEMTVTVEDDTEPPSGSPTDTPTDTPTETPTATPEDDDASGGGGGGGSLEAPGTPSITISETTLSDTTIQPGEFVRVTATLTNHGDGDGTKEVNLTIDGEVVDSIKVYVQSNDSRTVQLEHRVQETGSFDVSVGEVSTESLDVQEESAEMAPSSDDGELALVDLNAPGESVPVETSVDVEATFENTADERVTFDARLLIDGESATVEELSIPAGETATVTFEQSFATPGTYELTVNGTERTLVVEGDGGAETPDGSNDGSFPEPIHIAVGMVAVVAFVAAVGRLL